MLLGLLGLMPLLLFWSFTAMDFNLRKNDGHGSSYLYDWAKAHMHMHMHTAHCSV